MAVKKYKPTTNGRRNMSVLTFEEITTTTPDVITSYSIHYTKLYEGYTYFER